MHLIVAALLALSAGQRLHVDAVVERVMRDDRVAGLSLGIARRGNLLLYLRGYGLRVMYLAGCRPTGYTIYRIGSITKQFMAALAMQQVAAGRVALDAPAGRYLRRRLPRRAGLRSRSSWIKPAGIDTDAAGPDEPLVPNPAALAV